MKNQAIGLLLALGLVVYCAVKAGAKLEQVRKDCADLRRDVYLLQVNDETQDALVWGHEEELQEAGLLLTPKERFERATKEWLASEEVSDPTPPRVLPSGGPASR